MKFLYPVLNFFLAVTAMACSWGSYPFEYLAQSRDIIIVGEIVKMDYDLPHEPPYEDHHYSLAYLRIDELLKGGEELKKEKYFNFRVNSKKDGATTATIFFDKGMKGTWFFTKEEGPNGWFTTARMPLEISEKVKKELSYSYQRRFGDTFQPHLGNMEGAWPNEKEEEVPLISLVRHLQFLQHYDKCNVYITLNDDLDPNIMVKKVSFDQPVVDFLRDIAAQYDYLDYEFGDHQIMFFDRRKVEPNAGGNG